MSKCLFALYHDINVDGRSMELLKCAMLIGKTTLVSYKNYIDKPEELSEIIVANGKRNLIKYLSECRKIIKKEKPDYLFLENNYDAPLIKFAKKIIPSIKIIYDVSELYIGSLYSSKKSEIPLIIRIKQRLSNWLSKSEAKSVDYVDVVTIPSRERALIFQGYHNLKETPLVFDNMHKLDNLIDEEKYNLKYKELIENRFVVLYGGGVADSRYSFELCESIASLGPEYVLLVCGATSSFEKKRFDEWLTTSNVNNVIYLGMLKKDEWRYLIQKSHITVSAYKFEGMNLIFCASGKVYEGLFEGKPLLASSNPPFEELCKTFGVGIATEDFASGIIEIKNNYNYYCKNVERFIETLDYDSRIEVLKDKILHRTDRELNVKRSKNEH